jgi:hypothetical protein
MRVLSVEGTQKKKEREEEKEHEKTTCNEH